MLAYVKHQKTLVSKGKKGVPAAPTPSARSSPSGKSPKKRLGSSSAPPLVPPPPAVFDEGKLRTMMLDMMSDLLQQRRDIANPISFSAPSAEVPGPELGVAGGSGGANLMRGRPSASSGVVPPALEEDSPVPPNVSVTASVGVVGSFPPPLGLLGQASVASAVRGAPVDLLGLGVQDVNLSGGGNVNVNVDAVNVMSSFASVSSFSVSSSLDPSSVFSWPAASPSPSFSALRDSGFASLPSSCLSSSLPSVVSSVLPLSSSSSSLSVPSGFFPSPSPSLSSSLPPPPGFSSSSVPSSSFASLSISSVPSSLYSSVSAPLPLVPPPPPVFSSLPPPPPSSFPLSSLSLSVSSGPSSSLRSAPLWSRSSASAFTLPVFSSGSYTPVSSSLAFSSSSSSSSSSFPPFAASSSSSSFSAPLASAVSTVSSSSSSSAFPSSSSSGDFPSFRARSLGISGEYLDLVRWFVSSGGSDLPSYLSAHLPARLYPDFRLDFSSGSSALLASLSSFSAAPPPSSPPTSSASASAPAFLRPPASLAWSAQASSSSSSAPRLFASAASSASSSFRPPASSSSLSAVPAGFSARGLASVHGSALGLSSSVPSSLRPASSFAAPSVFRAPAPPVSAPPPSVSVPPPSPVFPSSAPASLPSSLPSSSAPLSSDPPVPEDPAFLDPAASLSSDAERSDFRRMLRFVLDLFPQAEGSPSDPPPSRGLLEDLLSSSSSASSSPSASSRVFLSLFDKVRSALSSTDERLASFLAAGRSDFSFFPSRVTAYGVRDPVFSGQALPVNSSLLSLFERQLKPSYHLGLSVKEAEAFEASLRAQTETLSHSLWVLAALLGFVRLQGFQPAESAVFSSLVSSLSRSLAHQSTLCASHLAFLVLKRRQFYLSHLPAYFSDVNKKAMLAAPAVYASTLFADSDVARLLADTQASSSLKSQQALVAVASRSAGRARTHSPRRSPGRPSSPARRRRRSSGSPSRPGKRVRFDSPAPTSSVQRSAFRK